MKKNINFFVALILLLGRHYAFGAYGLTTPVLPTSFPLPISSNSGVVGVWGSSLQGQLPVPYNLNGVAEVASGGDFILALLTNGKVTGWGDNSSSQIAIPSNLSNVVHLAAGQGHSVALLNNGTVVSWGANDANQTTVPNELSNVVQIAAGSDHTIALKANGTVTAWGYNGYGQTTIPVGLSNVVQIAAGSEWSMALKADGTISAWGQNNATQCSIPYGVTNVVQVAAGGTHSVALLASGTVVCWGDNTYGQCRIPNNLNGVIAVAAGWGHTVALRYDGSVVCWGLNTNSQATTPGALKLALQVAAGNNHSVALLSSGFTALNQPSIPSILPLQITNIAGILYGWGYNNYGQTTIPNGLTNIVQVASSPDKYTLALNSAGKVISFGNTNYSPYGSWNINQSNIVSIGFGKLGSYIPITLDSLGNYNAAVPGRLSYSTQVINTNQNYTNIPPDGYVNVADQGITQTYYTYDSYSTNIYTNLNIGSFINISGYYALNSSGSASLITNISTNYTVTYSTYYKYVYSFSSSGTNIYDIRWRTNTSTLSYSTNQTYLTNYLVSVSNNTLSNGVISISSAYNDSFFVLTNGTVLGIGTDSAATVPSCLAQVIQVSAGNGFAAALRTDGSVYVWGTGTVTNVPSTATNITQIAAGYNHIVALRSDGSVIAWGDNSYGQTNIPAGLSSIVYVAAGDRNTFVIKGVRTNPYSFPPVITNTGLGISGQTTNDFIIVDDPVVDWINGTFTNSLFQNLKTAISLNNSFLNSVAGNQTFLNALSNQFISSPNNLGVATKTELSNLNSQTAGLSNALNSSIAAQNATISLGNASLSNSLVNLISFRMNALSNALTASISNSVFSLSEKISPSNPAFITELVSQILSASNNYGLAVKQNQSLNFPEIPVQTITPTSRVTMNVTSSANQTPIIYSSGNTAVATVSNNVLQIMGSGSTTITASQAGNSLYNPISALQSLVVNKGLQTISFPAIPNQTFVPNKRITLKSSSSAGLTNSYIIGNGAIGSISNSVLLLLGTGSTSVTATNSGNAYFAPASATQILNVK